MSEKKGQETKTPQDNFDFSYQDSPIYLNSSARGEIEKINLPKLFTSTAEKVTKDLEISTPLIISVEAAITAKEGLIIDELGIGAYANLYSKTPQILFLFDPSRSDIAANLIKWEARQIAHELNHVARWNSYGEGALLDALIFEGLAVNYEENWGGEKQETLWGHVFDLEPKQLEIEWQKAQKELNSTLAPDNYRDWFFGENKGHPRWTGYTLGTAIVKSYLDRHPNEPMRETVKKASEEILEKSGFA